MSDKGPDFFDLVGDDGSPQELEQLRYAHDLLVAAGPAPELSPSLAEAPGAKARSRSASSARTPRRRAGTAFLLAGAVAAAAFGIGFLVADRGSGGDFTAKGSPIAMHPPSGAGNDAARASVLVGNRDEVGNWPLLVRVSGLKPLAKGQWYELYLTRKGKITDWCGAFSVKKTGRTSVRFSVPYSLKGEVGWVVTTGTRRADQQVLLST